MVVIPETHPPSSQSLHATLGTLFIGVVIAAAIWGIGSVQTYWYFWYYPEDSYRLRLLVAVTWLLSFLHQTFSCHAVYAYAILLFNRDPFHPQYVWSLVVQTLLEGILALTVQTFYVFRIYKLSKGNLLFTNAAGLLVFGKFGLTLAYVIISFHLKDIEGGFNHLQYVLEGINALGAASNIVITIIMCWILSNSRTGSRRTDTVLMRLIMYTANTGLLVTLTALLTLITAALRPHTFIYATFYLLLPGLYLNSMLASLNARHSISALGTICSSVILASTTRRDIVSDSRYNFNIRSPGHSSSHDPNFKFLPGSGHGVHIHKETVTSEAPVGNDPHVLSKTAESYMSTP